MVEILNPEGAPLPVGPYSVAAVAEQGSRTAYISGQVSADARQIAERQLDARDLPVIGVVNLCGDDAHGSFVPADEPH